MQFAGRSLYAVRVLAGALENQGRRGRNVDKRHADFALDRAPQAAHHPLRADAPLTPPVEVNQKAGIGHRQKHQKHQISSTHGSILPMVSEHS
jgi:hypothetical protein